MAYYIELQPMLEIDTHDNVLSAYVACRTVDGTSVITVYETTKVDAEIELHDKVRELMRLLRPTGIKLSIKPISIRRKD